MKISKFTISTEETNAKLFLKNNLILPRTHDDDRRRSINDIFKTPKSFGDLNLSYIYPDRTVAWHRHLKQFDYWIVIKGSLKVGLYDEEKKRLMWVYLHERDRKVLRIPPRIWHGWKNISGEESILMYWITQKYDSKNPDEERTEIGSFGENWDIQVR